MTDNTESPIPLKLQFKRTDLKFLPGMLPLMRSGRFLSVKNDIRKMLPTLKPTEFGYLPVSKEMRSNKKERIAFMNAITGMFRKDKSPWVIKWSPEQYACLLIRREDWLKAKGR